MRDCQTAAEVRALAREVIAKRKAREAELVARHRAALAAAMAPVFEPVIAAATDAPTSGYRRPPVRRKNLPEVQPEPALVDVQNAVCAAFHIPRALLLSAYRSRAIYMPRMLSMALCQHLRPDLSRASVGRLHGGRDHATALHAWHRMRWLLERLDAELRADAPPAAWAGRAVVHLQILPGKSEITA